jgi:hypothetical protein
MSFEWLFKLAIGTGAIFERLPSERAFCYTIKISLAHALTLFKRFCHEWLQSSNCLAGGFSYRGKTKDSTCLDIRLFEMGVPDWNEVIFLDECAFNIGGRYGKTYVT